MAGERSLLMRRILKKKPENRSVKSMSLILLIPLPLRV
jgi:hypothetical protein